jgi:hypothetical protein
MHASAIDSRSMSTWRLLIVFLIILTCSIRTKIILHALVSAFSFELAVPQAEIGARSKVVTRPIVKSEAGHGPQMPLFIRRVDDDM